MLDALDMQVRLSALQEATKNQLGHDAVIIVGRAAAFYAFLTGSPAFTNGPVETIDPLPLAGEPPIETGAAAAATEAVRRTRRTKAEMEAARAAERTPIEVGPIAEAAEATQAGPAPAAEPATIVDVKAAFMRVVETEGLGPKAGSALIKQFGVERISSLPEKDFAAAVKACDAAVAGAGK